MKIQFNLNQEETEKARNILKCDSKDFSKNIKAMLMNGKMDIQDIASVYTVLDGYDVHTLHKLLAIGVSEARHKKIKKIIDDVDLDEELQRPVKL